MSSTLQSSLTTAAERLRNIAQHVTNPLTNSIANATATITSAPPNTIIRVHHHPLSPTIFLPRAAAIEAEAPAIVHTTAAGKEIRRNYGVFAERTRGLAYYFKQRGYKRIGEITMRFTAQFFWTNIPEEKNLISNQFIKIL